MAIEKINFHYPKKGLQTVFDGDALTSLELSAVTSEKVDECIEIVNGVEQVAIQASAIVEDMKSQQEQFLLDNADTRSDMLADNQAFLTALELSNTTFQNSVDTSKTAFETSMNNDLATFQSNLNNAKSLFETTANTDLTNIETSFNTAFSNFQTSLNASKSSYETTMNTNVTNIVNNADSTIQSKVDNEIADKIADGTIATVVDNVFIEPIRNDLIERAINVKNYGVMGDGITDDTVAIQTLIDTHNVLYFPSGDYLHGGLIIPNKEFAMFGDSSGKTFFKAKNDNTVFIHSVQNYSMLTKYYDHIGFKGNSKSNVICFKFDRMNFTNFSNIIFDNVTYGFNVDCCRNSTIKNVFQLGDCCNKFYSTHANEYNFSLIVDTYQTETNYNPQPIGALFDLSFMVNTQWSNIVNMGRLECDAFYIHGMNEGVFISKCVLVCPKVGINIRKESGAYPNCIQVTDTSIDQYYTSGAIIQGAWVMFTNCAFVNGAQRNATESAVIILDDAIRVYFSNIISYGNTYAAFNIGSAQHVKLSNIIAWSTTTGYVYNCPTQSPNNPMISNCYFETVNANGFEIRNGSLDKYYMHSEINLTTLTVSEQSIIDINPNSNTLNDIKEVNINFPYHVDAETTIIFTLNDKQIAEFLLPIGDGLLDCKLNRVSSGYLTACILNSESPKVVVGDSNNNQALKLKVTVKSITNGTFITYGKNIVLS